MEKHVQHIIDEAIKTNSTFLDLGNCGLKAIPQEISDLPSSITHINFGIYYRSKNNIYQKTKHQFGKNDFSENATSLSFLNKLTTLKELEFRGCHLGNVHLEYLKELTNLTSLDISRNQIGDPGAQHLAQLTNLTSLNISRNQIGDPGAQHLAQLTNLTSLDISGNQIGDPGAQHLAQLTNLTSLIISWNQIGAPGAQQLAQLTNLTSLNISGNKISHAKFFKFLHHLEHLYLINNPIKDVPEFIHSKYDCIYELKIWWDETADEKKLTPNELVKLQVIGNGNAGKSSTIEALKTGECKTNFESTHGIVIEPLNYRIDKEQIHFQVWDFGGQEIYHGTHQLFLSSQSVHLFIADNESERLALKRERVPDRDSPVESVLHQPLQHYIELSKRQSPNSIRLVAKNKIDTDAQESNNIYEVAGKNQLTVYPISATKGIGIQVLRSALAEQRKNILHYGMVMPKSWLNVRQYFFDNLDEPVIDRRRLISRDKFYKICRNFDVTEKAIPSVLKFLHHTGVVYINETFLKDIIIADQKWAMEAVYKPLDRKSDFYDELRNDFRGRVRVKNLFKAFGNEYDTSQKWLFLSFMKSCGLCFPIHKINENETEDSYYIFPEFLPEKETPAVTELWKTAKEPKTYTYSPEYLDYFRIQKFIVEIGHKTNVEYIWKNGILVVTEKGKFLVEADTDSSSIQIHIESAIADEYLWMIIETFSKGNQGHESFDWVSEGGELLDLEILRKQNQRKKAKLNATNIAITHNENIDSDPEEKNISLQKALPDIAQKAPKRLVISFASEDLANLDSILDALDPYELDGKIEVLYDKKIIDGKGFWDEQIKEMFLNADGYLILASQSYQSARKHKYIWDSEIPIIKKRHSEKNIFTFCLKVRPVRLNDQLLKFSTFKGGKECLPESGHARDEYLNEFLDEIIDNKFLKDE